MTGTPNVLIRNAADPIDLIALEQEARRLRAEAAAELLRGLFRRVAGRFATRPAGVAQGA